MAEGDPRRRFALDHNFPAPFLATFASAMPYVELVAVADIDPTFAKLDDWELFLALYRHTGRWDGLVTNDARLLSQPKEMTVLSQTHLTLIVADGVGHDPIRAVGVLLAHLKHICHHTSAERAQVWKLGVRQKECEDAFDYLELIGQKRGETAANVFARHKLPSRELGGARRPR